MSVAFSTAAEDCLCRRLEAAVDDAAPSIDADDAYFNDFFEIPRLLKWIRDGGFLRIALQFPDELLRCSVRVASTLTRELGEGMTLFVLGDTSYGSCCVDEVAAQHGDAEAVIHFGPSCLSPPSKLPVAFVFGRRDIDHDDFIEKCQSVFSPTDPILFLYDPFTFSLLESLAKRLVDVFENVVVSRLLIPRSDDVVVNDDEVEGTTLLQICRRKIRLPRDRNLNEYKILYVGREGPSLTDLLLHFSNEFYTYDPVLRSIRKESLIVNKSLSKRYFLIEKAKDANIIGILAGTLGVADYLTVIKRLKDLIRSAGKKSYLFVVGKLNVPKLANFQEIDLFVLVACPQNSLIDSREFFQPVLTPHELEMALNPRREWSPRLITDFRNLLPGRPDFVDDEGDVEERIDVSLITGQLRHLGSNKSKGSEEGNSTVATRTPGVIANVTSGADFLENRSWRGLEQNLGSTPVVLAAEGAKGIAAGYDYENQTPTTTM